MTTQPVEKVRPNGHAAWEKLTHALRVLPMAQVVPHESYHPQRVADLADRLTADGRLVNPPIAAPLDGKFVVLDGATRLTALQRLGFAYIIVQAVEPDPSSLQLYTWHHVVRGGAPGALVERLRTVRGLAVTPAPKSELHPMPMMPKTLGHLVTPDGHGYRLAVDPAQGDAALAVLNRMVEAYGAWGNVERTLGVELGVLTEQYRDLAGLVILPRFSIQGVLDMAVQGQTVPAGITRFVIPGRILRLNAPLAKLHNDEPVEVKQRWLDNLVREKIAYRQVRYYEEPVLLLDE